MAKRWFVNVAIAETLPQNREGGLAGAVTRGDEAHIPVITQGSRYGPDLVVVRRQ
jgi:hypothetical protein